jgi:hypothetical protein
MAPYERRRKNGKKSMWTEVLRSFLERGRWVELPLIGDLL